MLEKKPASFFSFGLQFSWWFYSHHFQSRRTKCERMRRKRVCVQIFLFCFVSVLVSLHLLGCFFSLSAFYCSCYCYCYAVTSVWLQQSWSVVRVFFSGMKKITGKIMFLDVCTELSTHKCMYECIAYSGGVTG